MLYIADFGFLFRIVFLLLNEFLDASEKYSAMFSLDIDNWIKFDII